MQISFKNPFVVKSRKLKSSYVNKKLFYDKALKNIIWQIYTQGGNKQNMFKARDSEF